MRITSRITYLLPFIVLLIPSFLISLSLKYYLFNFNHSEQTEDVAIALLTIIVATGLYIGMRKLIVRVSRLFFRIAILLFPLLLQVVMAVVTRQLHTLLGLSPFVSGGLLYLSWLLLDGRYIATLTATSIQYENLLGQTGEIPLHAISKLEQKKQLLSVFRELRFLSLAKKTGIGFYDENRDEYEINIFTKIFKSRTIFDTIIEHANSCENFKIRQYVI